MSKNISDSYLSGWDPGDTHKPPNEPFTTQVPMAQQQAAVVSRLTKRIKRLEARGGDKDKIEQLREVLRYHLGRT